MKKQLLLTAGLAACLLAAAQGQKTDLETRKLRGRVKSVIETVYELVLKFGEPEKGAAREKVFIAFNTAGYETEYASEDLTTGEKKHKWWRYNSRNQVVEIKEEAGRKTSFTKLDYNPEGKLTTADFTDEKQNLTSRQKYKYDGNGLPEQVDSYNGDGSRKSKIVFTYNGKKQLVKKEWFKANGASTYVELYAYDANGNRVEEKSRDTEFATADTMTKRYHYNQKGQKVREQFSRNNFQEQRADDFEENFEYNEEGDVVKRELLITSEKTTYTYDRNHNWIKAEKTEELYPILMETMKQKPTRSLVERQIRYY